MSRIDFYHLKLRSLEGVLPVLLQKAYAAGKRAAVKTTPETVERIGGAKGLFVFNSVMVYMLLLRFAMTIRMFVRFQLYFSVFVAIAVGLLLISFEYKSRLAYWSILCLVSLYMCTDKITGSARYVPYSNYIVYSIKGENPSYSTRYYYNIKHSPYTVDDDYAH